MIPPGESVRYLGVWVGPGQVIVIPDLIQEVGIMITRISEAPLKPAQWLQLLNSFALPQLVYWADLGGVPATKLARIDGLVRKAVKQWLHLPLSAVNGLLYAGRCVRDGGLGVLRLERLIPSIQLRRLYQMSKSPDL